MKKIISIILILLIVTAVGCGNNIEKKAMDQARLALANKEYDKALASFQLVLDENSENNEAAKIKGIIDTYINAKKLYDNNNLDEADKKISIIHVDYPNYAIKDDVDLLKTDIKNKISSRDKVKNDIAKVEGLVNEKKYDEAKKMLDGFNQSDLDENQKNKINALSSTMTTDLAKVKEVKQEKEVQQKAQAKKELTKEEAKNLIMQADSSEINQAMFRGETLHFSEEYTKARMPYTTSWNIEPEDSFEYWLGGEDETCGYLVGKQSKKVYRIPHQGCSPIYQMANNQKVKICEWIGTTH